MRLDFETFNILGPANSLETTATPPATDGGACQDTFTVTTTTGQLIPTICGVNDGQHIYVDLGRGSDDKATITINLSSAASADMRMWQIKASQYACGANAPPEGCLQWFTGHSGRIETFNFANGLTNGHLADQDYSACVRQEEGFCCVEYEHCDDASSFTSDSTAGADNNADCVTRDFIGIEGSGAQCVLGGSQPLFNRYCGDVLSADTTATLPTAVCDCTAPFAVTVHHDSLSDFGAAPGDTNTAISRGTCLTYRQKPCN